MPSNAVEQLADDLDTFWQHYRPCFRTRTRDTSDCARTFWRGKLTMEDQRNFANIDRRLNRRDGQALQHFMSGSPWRIELTADPDQGMTIAWYVADTRFESMDEGERHSPLPREKYRYLWRELNV